MIDYKMIGKRIREKRLEQGINQEVLAEYLNVVPEYISKIENGKVKINLKRLAEIALYLETPIEFFIAGTVSGSKEYLSSELSEMIATLDEYEKRATVNIIKEIRTLREKDSQN